MIQSLIVGEFLNNILLEDPPSEIINTIDYTILGFTSVIIFTI